MGLSQLIVSKHAALARVLFPASIAGGFLYTVKTGSSPLEDAASAVKGNRQYSIRIATAPAK